MPIAEFNVWKYLSYESYTLFDILISKYWSKKFKKAIFDLILIPKFPTKNFTYHEKTIKKTSFAETPVREDVAGIYLHKLWVDYSPVIIGAAVAAVQHQKFELL